MAEIISSFPNNADEYQGAEEVMKWLHGRTKGVYAGDGNAAVSAVQNAMQVQVAPGIGWITDANDDGICWWFDAAVTLDIDAAESTGTLDRIDRVIIEWKTTDYADKPELKVLKGTSSSSATAPALTNNSSTRQISLARISIPAGTTELTALNIIDERLDPAVCGIVTETVMADTSMIAVQYDEALQELLSAIAQAWSGVISDGSITRAKLAPPLLEEIGVNSVNGKSGTVVLDADDVGAMPEWERLWANASPGSSFAAQTVSLDLSGYSAVAIFFKRSTDAGYDQGLLTFIALIGQTYIDQMMTASGSNVAFLMRQFSTSNSGITFAAAKLSVQGSASSEADRTQYLIPLYIYGIKGVA